MTTPTDAANVRRVIELFSESAKVLDLSAARARSGLSVEQYCAEIDKLAGAPIGTALAAYRLGQFFA